MSHVLILGAGAAGLAAARHLHREGISFTVIEARDRIGGRVWTRYEAHGPVELGAEFVHGRSPITFELIEEAGLTVSEGSDLRLFNSGEGLEPETEFREIIEKINGRIDPERDETYRDFLSRAQASDYEKEIARSYCEGFNAADYAQIGTAGLLKADEAAAEIDGEHQFRITEGYHALLQSLADSLPPAGIQLEAVAQRILWKPGRVTIEASTASGPITFVGERLLVTLPLGVLQAGSVVFDPPLVEKEHALAHLVMGDVFRVVVRFRERFWESLGAFAFAQAFHSDLPVWWTREPLKTSYLTGWCGGPGSLALIDLSPVELRSRVLGSLAYVFSRSLSFFEDEIEAIHFHNWTRDPYSLGAYSYPKVGGLAAGRELAAPIKETLFFAGEATDYSGHNGTVHAALETGVRAAREIVLSPA